MNKKDTFFFDDCAVCRAMQGAENEGRVLSEDELVKAFQEQKKRKDQKNMAK